MTRYEHDKCVWMPRNLVNVAHSGQNVTTSELLREKYRVYELNIGHEACLDIVGLEKNYFGRVTAVVSERAASN